jgi:hypothetical protein
MFRCGVQTPGPIPGPRPQRLPGASAYPHPSHCCRIEEGAEGPKGLGLQGRLSPLHHQNRKRLGALAQRHVGKRFAIGRCGLLTRRPLARSPNANSTVFPTRCVATCEHRSARARPFPRRRAFACAAPSSLGDCSKVCVPFRLQHQHRRLRSGGVGRAAADGRMRGDAHDRDGDTSLAGARAGLNATEMLG